MADPTDTTLLEAVISQMPAGVIIAEAPTGRLLATNAKVQKIWRTEPRSATSVEGYAVWRGFRPDGSEYSPHEWPLARSLERGEAVENEEIEILRGDGTRGYIRVSSAPIRANDGAILAAVVTFTDVTTERREHDALALLAEMSAITANALNSGETLQAIARMAVPSFADIVFVHRMSDGQLQRSEVAAADPAVERLIRDLWAASPVAVSPLAAVIASGKPVLREVVTDDDWRGVHPDQSKALSTLGIRSAISIPLFGSGVPVGALSFALTRESHTFDSFDVLVAEQLARRAATAIEKSVLFEAERAQRIRAEESNARIAYLQELTASLLPAVTAASVYDTTMEATKRVVDSRSTVIGILHGERIEIVRTRGIDPELVAKVTSIDLETDWPLADAVRSGEPVWLRNRDEASAARMFMGELTDSRAWAALPLMVKGKAIGAIGFSFNEEQTFPEEEQKFLMSIAGQCAIALERALLFDSERNARQDAEAASRAKDDFLAVLSHELRTPMTTVIGWADFLTMTHGSDPAVANPVEALRNSARVQAKLVDDLLDVSRIVAGKLSIHKRDIELGAVLRAAVASVQIPAKEKEIALRLDVSGAPIPIHADPDRLQQIFTNILVNGIKFTPRGGWVDVRVARRDHEADVIIQDSGEGIDPAFLPHVFDRFRQASDGDSRRHTGLGLGLSIVEHLVQRHGGRVVASSEGVGHGARFTVTLPVN